MGPKWTRILPIPAQFLPGATPGVVYSAMSTERRGSHLLPPPPPPSRHTLLHSSDHQPPPPPLRPPPIQSGTCLNPSPDSPLRRYKIGSRLPDHLILRLGAYEFFLGSDSSKLHDPHSIFFLNFPGFFLDSVRGSPVSPIRLRRIFIYSRLHPVGFPKDLLLVW